MPRALCLAFNMALIPMSDNTQEYDICLTCGWEYDPVQNDKPDRKGGANSDSLNEHRDWYKRMYTKDKKFKWCDTWKS